MTTTRPPRTTAAATDLLARYAELDTRAAAVEAHRKAEIGRINAAADAEAGPMREYLGAMAAQLRTWWDTEGRTLATGARKSVQLGGCMIGTRTARASLAHDHGGEDAAVAALRSTRYAKQTTRVKYAIDRTAVLKLLQGETKAGAAIGALGFRVEQGEAFFVERVEQAGVVGA